MVAKHKNLRKITNLKFYKTKSTTRKLLKRFFFFCFTEWSHHEIFVPIQFRSY